MTTATHATHAISQRCSRRAVAGFDSTHWSIVLRARGETTDARAALEALCRRYRPPVLAYIRRHARGAENAEDLAQAFFARFLEHAYYADADPARGRFRAFLLTTLKRFLIDVDEAAHATRRGGAVRFMSLDSARGPHPAHEVADPDSPECAFERSWAAAVLDAAMARLREEGVRAGKRRLFEQLSDFLIERPDEADYRRVAAALNLRRNTVAVAVHRLRARLRELVRAELAETTSGPGELEAELRHLRHTLRETLA